MDATVVAAVVGGIATIAAAMVGLWVKGRTESKEQAQRLSDGSPVERSIPPPTPSQEVNFEPMNFRRYKLSFLAECEKDLAILNLDKVELIQLIESEFLAHMNYFVYDLEAYAMPVKARFIVHIDKIDEKLTFKRVFSCTANEAKLTSWNDILTLYRRATRLAYRENPEDMLFIQSMLPRTRQMHLELIYRIVRHFQTYELLKLDIDPTQIVAAARLQVHRPAYQLARVISDNYQREHYPTDVPDAKTKEIDFHLRQAVVAWTEIEEIEKDFKDGLIKEKAALGALITSAERSLQFIHKLLLLHPPIE